MFIQLKKTMTKTKKLQILKRDGRQVSFDVQKIYSAVESAYKNTLNVLGLDEDTEKKISDITFKVVKQIQKSEEVVSVEEIQNIIEDVLLKAKENAVAKKFISYRANRTQIREANTKLMNDYKSITFSDAETSDVKRENANVDGNTAMGTMLQYGSTGSKQFAVSHLLSKEASDAHKNGKIHIHD